MNRILVHEAICEKALCGSCGTDVRVGSQFCYNCGEAIDQEPPPPAILKPDEPILKRMESPVRRSPSESVRRANSNHRQVRSDGVEAGPGRPETRKRVPASRPGARTKRNEKVEFEWVEPRASPSIRLLITAVILAILGGLMLIVAWFLK